MFLDLPDPDPLVQGTGPDPDPDPSIIKQKKSKKNLDSNCFVTLYDFLPLKNDVNVASKSKRPKTLPS
jgi:hypothetical protein